nr:MAG TPA: hypothetical protein [Caudoviricetes sp.]
MHHPHPESKSPASTEFFSHTTPLHIRHNV